MLHQYFTYRQQYINGGHAPLDYHYAKNFKGLDFTVSLAISQGYHNDGRSLGMVEAVSQDIIDVVMRSYPVDLETPTQALDKAKRWSTLPADKIEEIVLVDDKIVFPTLDE